LALALGVAAKYTVAIRFNLKKTNFSVANAPFWRA
jgi:hypothetical protein